MKQIKPNEISGSILTLIEESKEWLVLVSPYVKLSKWYRLIRKLIEIRNSEVHMEVYVRDDPNNTATYTDLNDLMIRYEKIPHLHCKLYMNERYAIVTSLNLLLSSEINSLEIGFITETQAEYSDLVYFFHTYIRKNQSGMQISGLRNGLIDSQDFFNKIKASLNASFLNAWILPCEKELEIGTGKNRYEVNIEDGFLFLSVCLNKAGIDHIREKVSDLSKMKVAISPGPSADFIQLSGSTWNEEIQSASITKILNSEVPVIVDSILRFINTVESLS